MFTFSQQFSGLLGRINEMRYANRQNAFEREQARAAIQNRIEAHGVQIEAHHVEGHQGGLYAMEGDGLMEVQYMNGAPFENLHPINEPLQVEVQPQAAVPPHALPHLLAYPPPHAPEPVQALPQQGAAAPPHGQAQQPPARPPPNAQEQQPPARPLPHAQAQQPPARPPPHAQAQQPPAQPPQHAQAQQAEILPPAQQIGIPNPAAGRQRRPYHAIARENAEALNTFLTRELPVLTRQIQQTINMMNELIRRQLDQ